MQEGIVNSLDEPAACPTAYDNVADLPVSVEPGTDPVTHKSELSVREIKVMGCRNTYYIPSCIQHDRDRPTTKRNVRDVLCIVGVGDSLTIDASATL